MADEVRPLHHVNVYALDGTFLRSFGTFGTGVGQFRYPSRLAARQGRVYVADRDNSRIAICDRYGAVQREIDTTATCPVPYHVAALPDRACLVAAYDQPMLAAYEDSTGGQMWTLSLDSVMDGAWQATRRGKDFADHSSEIHALKTLPDGGFVVAVRTWYTDQFPTLLRFDADRTLLWKQELPTVTEDHAFYWYRYSLHGLAVTDDGHLCAFAEGDVFKAVYGFDDTFHAGVNSLYADPRNPDCFRAHLDWYDPQAGGVDLRQRIGWSDSEGARVWADPNLITSFKSHTNYPGQLPLGQDTPTVELARYDVAIDEEYSWPTWSPLPRFHSDVALDNLGRVYVLKHRLADGRWGHEVQVYDASGRSVRSFAAQGTGAGQIGYPAGIAIDADLGEVYITDWNVEHPTGGLYIYTNDVDGHQYLVYDSSDGVRCAVRTGRGYPFPEPGTLIAPDGKVVGITRDGQGMVLVGYLTETGALAWVATSDRGVTWASV